jgi:hypothetical protein
MLKVAVLGAQSLAGRELVGALEPHCSVLPLSAGALTQAEEEGDLVVFAPDPALLEGIEIVILMETPQEDFLKHFQGRILDLRTHQESSIKSEAMPLMGPWPKNELRLHTRPAVEQVLALLPQLFENLGEIAGTHLRSVAYLGDAGLSALFQQSTAVMQGEDPDTETLGYRLAFEMAPQAPRGNIIEVRVPVFHGDLLVLQLRAVEGKILSPKDAPAGVKWVTEPPSSRDVAVSAELLAHRSVSKDGRSATLTLGFDPILWGVLRPTLRLLGLAGM